jgi:hypothetical protein
MTVGMSEIRINVSSLKTGNKTLPGLRARCRKTKSLYLAATDVGCRWAVSVMRRDNF